LNPGSLQIKRNKELYLVIEDINTSQFIGLFALNLEKASKWRSLVQVTFRSLGKGYGTEAANRVLDFNDLNLHRIKAGCARKYSFY
jgi:RimJ/RimL family protein N-acetyltransferase